MLRLPFFISVFFCRILLIYHELQELPTVRQGIAPDRIRVVADLLQMLGKRIVEKAVAELRA